MAPASDPRVFFAAERTLLAVLAALRNHLAYVRALPPADVPELPMRWLPLVASAAIALVGILLAAYLALGP